MAKPKEKVFIEKFNGCFYVYCDNPQSVLTDIASIEGVAHVLYLAGIKSISVNTDPRYDIDEIIEEIKTLLLSEVPDVFRE